MNEVLRSILTTKNVYTESGESRVLHSHIDEDEGHFLQALIHQHRPESSL